jgi:hypothetical protein
MAVSALTGSDTDNALCSCLGDARCNIGRKSLILAEGFHDFAQSIQDNNSIRPGLLPSKSFPMNHSSVILPFNAAVYLLTASLNKPATCKLLLTAAEYMNIL